MCSMLRSVLSRGWTPSLDRGVLGRQAERVEALRVQHVHAVARAEARDDVADRVDEHVPDVQRPRRVREHLEDVALRPQRQGRSRRGTPSRPPRRAATAPRSSSRRMAPSIVLIRFGEQKSLSRERPGGIAAAAPRSVPGLRKKLLHEPKTVPGRIRRCSSSSRTRRTHRAGGALARRRAGTSELAERLRDAARRLLRGDAPLAGTRASRSAVPDAQRLLRDEGVPERRACCVCSRRRGSAPTSPRSGELAFARAAGLGASSSSCTGTTKSDEELPRRCRCGRDRRARRDRTRPSARLRRASAACSYASRSASRRTRTRRS